MKQVERVTCTINEQTFEAEKGQTVLEVARANGIYIPTLCHHPRIGQAGLCRICIVEIEGRPGFQVSCATQVQQGMKIQTSTQRVLDTRRTIVELMLADGTHNCISCDACGDCALQEVAYRLGIERSPFPGAPKDMAPDAESPFIIRDMNRCITCFRCVKGCQEHVVNEVLSMAWRGRESRVVCDDDRPMHESSCVFCGECVQLCPVGALREKKSEGRGRTWEMRKVRTTCPYCGVGCQLELHTRENRIVKVTGAEDSPPNYGSLCVKGRFGYDFVSHPDRLKSPLLRRNGTFEAVTWDEALDFAASRLGEIKGIHGADSIAGISCARTTNENNFAMMKMMRAAVGTNNLDHCART